MANKKDKLPAHRRFSIVAVNRVWDSIDRCCIESTDAKEVLRQLTEWMVSLGAERNGVPSAAGYYADVWAITVEVAP